MSCYLERTENVARFIDVNLSMLLDLSWESQLGNPWQPLVNITGDDEFFREKYKEATAENVIQFHTFDLEYPNSILSCLTAARENARSIREIISSEMWEQINKLYLMVKWAARNETGIEDAPHFFKQVKMDCHLISGITNVTLNQDEAWDFIQLGRYLERADKTSRILDVKYFLLLPRVDLVGSSLDKIQWAALLKSTSGLEAYRKNFRQVLPKNVAKFLILDRHFPRSILHCLAQAYRSLYSVVAVTGGPHNNLPERRLGKLRAKLSYTTIDEIIDIGMHEYLDGVQHDLNLVMDAIHEAYFVPQMLISK